jgi:hypothetical protein
MILPIFNIRGPTIPVNHYKSFENLQGFISFKPSIGLFCEILLNGTNKEQIRKSY